MATSPELADDVHQAHCCDMAVQSPMSVCYALEVLKKSLCPRVLQVRIQFCKWMCKTGPSQGVGSVFGFLYHQSSKLSLWMDLSSLSTVFQKVVLFRPSPIHLYMMCISIIISLLVDISNHNIIIYLYIYILFTPLHSLLFSQSKISIPNRFSWWSMDPSRWVHETAWDRVRGDVCGRGRRLALGIATGEHGPRSRCIQEGCVDFQVNFNTLTMH